MQNQATKMKKNQLALFSGGEAVEDLLYEFLKNRSPLTERAYRTDFMGLSESDQYILTHHEYAGVAGFELDKKAIKQALDLMMSMAPLYLKRALNEVAVLNPLVDQAESAEAQKSPDPILHQLLQYGFESGRRTTILKVSQHLGALAESLEDSCEQLKLH